MVFEINGNVDARPLLHPMEIYLSLSGRFIQVNIATGFFSDVLGVASPIYSQIRRNPRIVFDIHTLHVKHRERKYNSITRSEHLH